MRIISLISFITFGPIVPSSTAIASGAMGKSFIAVMSSFSSSWLTSAMVSKPKILRIRCSRSARWMAPSESMMERVRTFPSWPLSNRTPNSLVSASTSSLGSGVSRGSLMPCSLM